MPSVPSIVPPMLLQEFDDTPEELEAARIRSEQIDAELAAEGHKQAKKRALETMVLLLGQSGAGKSTLKKQFQILCQPESMDAERASWRGVIFMNVLRSVRDIMEVLGVGDDFENHSVTSPGSDDSFGRQNIGGTASTHLLGLFYRLKPLLSMEKHLADRISASYMDDRNTGEQHLYVRRGWQSTPFTTADTLVPISLDGGRPSLDGDEVLSDVSAILLSLKDEIKALWGSPDVQQGLKRGRILLGETASTFLHDLDRISSPGWSPTDEDILRARLRTVGLETYEYDIPTSKKAKQASWRLVDVGGSQNQRHTWVPFFEGSDAIIFLAPISAFDQYLDENPDMNRMEDSVRLFKYIVSHPLLANTHIILLLNKVDLLKDKLRRGVQVSKFIPSYAGRPNTAESVIEYFHSHFKGEFEQSNVGNTRRSLTVFKSSVVDIATTRTLILNIVKKLNEQEMATAYLGLGNRTGNKSLDIKRTPSLQVKAK